jgi:benzoate/toluate 1,2-dioxygenase alpha subunit
MTAASKLIDDRPDDGVFRVSRTSFTDAEIFDREMSEIFERTWLYLCHESQVPNHGDYVAARIGRQPVFVIRGSDGEIRCFYDACTHRGSKLTGRTSGSAKTLTCRYHGWCFNADGACTLVRGGDEAYLAPDLARMGTNLRPIEKFGSYKGFLFGCLDAAAPSLEDFLGGAMPFIDLMADQSPDGMEVLRGESRYMMDANWKFQTENSTDGYHVATVHRNFATTVGYRETLRPDGGAGMEKTEASRILSLDKIGSGGYDVGNGHMINWADRGNPEAGPLWPQRDALLARFDAGKVKWMLERGRTVTVFPNLLLNDVASTCIRVWRPVDVGLTEIETWCLAPKGEDADARRARIRKYEDFFFPASLAVPDDVRAMEGAHTGSMAMARTSEGAWNDLALGRKTLVPGPDEAAGELGVAPLTSNPGREVETPFYAFWREWAHRLDA